MSFIEAIMQTTAAQQHAAMASVDLPSTCAQHRRQLCRFSQQQHHARDRQQQRCPGRS